MLGVSVIEVGTKTGVATDLDGNFTLNVPQGAKQIGRASCRERV